MRELKDIIHNGKNMLEWLEINKTQDANLRDADLRCANMSGANLSGANLRYANLRYANLRDANLSGNYSEVLSVFSAGQHQGIATCTHIAIGCERHTHQEWRDKYQSIGEKHKYTSEQIERYRAWIFSLDWIIK